MGDLLPVIGGLLLVAGFLMTLPELVRTPAGVVVALLGAVVVVWAIVKDGAS